MCNFLQSVLIPALQQRGLHQASSSCCWMWSRSAFSAAIHSLSFLYKDQIFLSYLFCESFLFLTIYFMDSSFPQAVTNWFVLIFSLFDADWLHFSVFITRVIFVPLLIMYVHKALLWREKNIGIALAHLHADKCLLSACRCADAIPMFNLFKAMLCGQTLKRLQKNLRGQLYLVLTFPKNIYRCTRWCLSSINSENSVEQC